jgi:hypothetical protein
MAALCSAVAALVGLAAGLGVFARGDGATELVTSVRGETYEMAISGVYANNAMRIVAEGVGWDVFTLVIVVPALLLLVPLVMRGSFRGRLVAAGLLGYFAYMYLEYAVTWAFGPLFVLFVAIFAASLLGLIWIAATLASDGIAARFDERFPRRSWAALSVGMSLLLGGLWFSRIGQALTDGVSGYLHGETTMTVQALDLGLVVPISCLIAVLAWRRNDAGLVAASAFAVTYVAMSAAIASMLVSAWLVTGVIELPPIIVFAAACVLGIVIGTRMYISFRTDAAARVDQLVPAASRPADLPAAG